MIKPPFSICMNEAVAAEADDAPATGGVPEATEQPASGSLLDGAGSKDGEATGAPGERPETIPEKFWDAEAGQPRVDAMAKSYAELQSKLTSLTSAPDDYEVSLPEGVEAELNLDDPMLGDFKEFAKENGIPQETFTKLTHWFMQNEYEANQQDVAGELERLGDRAKQRLDNLADWSNANLSQEMRDKMHSLVTNADAVEVMEAIIAKTRGTPTAIDDTPAPTGITADDVRRARFAKDEATGRTKYEIDPAYRKQVDDMYAKVYGREPKDQAVG